MSGCGLSYVSRGRGRGIRSPLHTREDNGQNRQQIHGAATDSLASEGEPGQRNLKVAPPVVDEEQEEMQKFEQFLNEPNPSPLNYFIKTGSRVPRGGSGSSIGMQVRGNGKQTGGRPREDYIWDYSTSSVNQPATLVPSRLIHFVQTGSYCPPTTNDVKVCEHRFVTTSGLCDPTKDFQVCIKCHGVSCGVACSKCTVDNSDVTDGSVQQENVLQAIRPKDNHRDRKSKGHDNRKTGMFAHPTKGSYHENVQLANREEEEQKKKNTISNIGPAAKKSSGSSSVPIYYSTEGGGLLIAASAPKSDALQFNHVSNSESITPPSTSRRESAVANPFYLEAPVSELTDTFEDYFTSLQNEENGGQGIDVLCRLPPGIPLKVKVVAVLESVCVFVQTETQQKMIATLHTQLKNQKLMKLGMSEIFYGNYVTVVHENGFYRAQVEGKDASLLEFRVRLVDCGVTIIKHVRDIYQLPQPILRTSRQVNSLTIAGIQPSKEGHLKESLKSLLVGHSVIVTITHAVIRLECLTCHYYGSVTLPGESVTLSEDLIEKKLALPSNFDGNQFVRLIKPEFKDYEAPLIKKNEVVRVRITSVVSPDEFYVRKVDPEKEDRFDEKLEELFRNVGWNRYSAAYFDGSRMCMTFKPDSNNTTPVRGFCKEIDFTVEPIMATVFLIDHGTTCIIPLNHLNEYSHPIKDYQPQAYRVGIAVKPANNEWSVEATECLMEIMKYNKKGRKVELTCVGQVDNASIVEMMVGGCTNTWNQGLQEVGEALNASDKELDEIRVPVCPSSEFIHFRNTDCDLSKCAKRHSTPYSFSNIPPATVPSEGEFLETRRRKGLYEYLVMTSRAYDMHQELKKYCLDLVASGKAEPGDYEFKIGDVAIVKWNPTTYQRCAINGFENRNGVCYAILTAFDIEQIRTRPLGLLKRPDDFVMNMEKLCHVVWLEGIDENTLVFSKDLAEFIDPFFQHTTLKKLKVLANNKLIVRLEMLDSSGNAVLLSKQLEKYSKWSWERYFNAGFLSQSSLLKKLYCRMKFIWDLAAFWKAGATMQKGTHKVELRRVNYTKNPDVLTIDVIPQSDDFNLLNYQMKNFYSKITINDKKPFSDSPTYPNIVFIYDRDPAKAKRLNNWKLKSPCEGHHRCVYMSDEQTYECVDCFQMTKVRANFDPFELFGTHGVEIREICPEMLRVPPVGKRLLVKLLVPTTNPRTRICIDEILKPGRWVSVQINPEEPSEDGKPIAEIPEITNRLTELKEKIKEEALKKGCLENTTGNT